MEKPNFWFLKYGKNTPKNSRKKSKKRFISQFIPVLNALFSGRKNFQNFFGCSWYQALQCKIFFGVHFVMIGAFFVFFLEDRVFNFIL